MGTLVGIICGGGRWRGAVCGLAGLGCAAAGFAGEFAGFVLTPELTSELEPDAASAPRLSLPRAASPDASVSDQLSSTGSPLAGLPYSRSHCRQQPIPPASRPTWSQERPPAYLRRSAAASRQCFPSETAPGTVVGLSGTEGSRRAWRGISAARARMAPLCATGSRSSFSVTTSTSSSLAQVGCRRYGDVQKQIPAGPDPPCLPCPRAVPWERSEDRLHCSSRLLPERLAHRSSPVPESNSPFGGSAKHALQPRLLEKYFPPRCSDR